MSGTGSTQRMGYAYRNIVGEAEEERTSEKQRQREKRG
jgi:hypothetical protein